MFSLFGPTTKHFYIYIYIYNSSNANNFRMLNKLLKKLKLMKFQLINIFAFYILFKCTEISYEKILLKQFFKEKKDVNRSYNVYIVLFTFLLCILVVFKASAGKL